MADASPDADVDELLTARQMLEEHARYRAALQRIAEADEQAHPLVKIALEALNP